MANTNMDKKKLLAKIELYRQQKDNNMFDYFYHSDLNVFVELIEDSTPNEALRDLRDLVWGLDVPHPTCPEYVELHEGIQKILGAIDKLLNGGTDDGTTGQD